MIVFSWDTTQDSLLAYFTRFGEVIDCVVMKNSETGRSRGFGFVTFSDPTNIESVLASCPHTLDGRTIDPKACNPRSQQKPKKVATQHFPKVHTVQFYKALPVKYFCFTSCANSTLSKLKRFDDHSPLVQKIQSKVDESLFHLL